MSGSEETQSTDTSVQVYKQEDRETGYLRVALRKLMILPICLTLKGEMDILAVWTGAFSSRTSHKKVCQK